MKTAFLVSGRGSNLQVFLDARAQGTLAIEIVAVGSDQADAQALERARQVGIPVRAFPVETYPNRQAQETELLGWLKDSGVELLLLAGYMRVLSSEFVREAGFPILNIHPSLLPAFPGTHAQRQALEYGVKVSGCTVHFVDEGLDSGPIILQEAVLVRPGDTEEDLAARILEAEHRIYPEAVRLLLAGRLKPSGRTVAVV